MAFVVLTLLGIFCSIPIYRLFFSPLSRFPGPKIWAISRIPFAYHMFSGLLPYHIHTLHEKFGPIVRLAPTEVSFTCVEAWIDIYGKQAGKEQLQKDPLTFLPPSTGVNGILFEFDDAEHNRIRRNFALAFSDKSMREQEPLISNYIDLLITKLGILALAGKEIDMSAWFNFLTFDVIGDLVFGESFECLESAELHWWVRAIFEWVSGAAILGMTQMFWPMSHLIRFLIPKHVKEAEGRHRATTTRKLDKRLAMKGQRSDFISQVKLVVDTPTGVSYPELLETANTLIAGGSETMATTLSFLLFQLLSHPTIFNQLKSEIRSSFTDAKEITMQNVYKLEYMSACLNETFRLWPPVPGNLRRVTPPEGCTIAGHFIPGNTIVAVDMLAAYRSSANFARPMEFIPERWLPSPPEEFKNDEQKIVQPFSIGPRNCIGKNLANMEMRLILARLLFAFDVSLEDSGKDFMTGLKAWGFWKRKGLFVKLTPTC